MKDFDCWSLAHEVAPHCDRLLFNGPPGTGKTRFACDQGENAVNVTLTEETPAAELRGHFIQKGGNFVWMHGPGVRAWLDGAVLVLNEINRASADCQSFLLNLLDDPEIARITLPTGEVVRPKAGFRAIATMNGDPEELTEALRDRFAVRIFIDRPHPGAILRLPKELQQAALQGAMLEEERRTSIRSWLSLAHLMPLVGEQAAAQAVFGERGRELLAAIKIGKVK